MATEQPRKISDSRVLLGRVAIVTGSGQGIGRGIAICLARAGADVVVCEKVAERIAPTVAEIEKLGAKGLGIATDVTQADDVARMVQQSIAHFGKIDILVNNAGTAVIKPMIEHTEEEWDRVLDLNLKGVFLCCRQVLPDMIARRSGAIVNIASIAALGVTVPHVPYAASKAGVVALTRDLAHEVARFGVRVNAIAPGPTDTPLMKGGAERRKEIAKTILLGRVGHPEDMGEAAVFLASDSASFITGVTLPVSGGKDLGPVSG